VAYSPLNMPGHQSSSAASRDSSCASQAVPVIGRATHWPATAALTEIARVHRPGGELRYFQHVISSRTVLARLERLLDATVYPPLAGGCHCSRDTGAAIRQAGFQIEREARIAVREAQLGPSVRHILGSARLA
jgi:hypothetical protein